MCFWTIVANGPSLLWRGPLETLLPRFRADFPSWSEPGPGRDG